jgi:transposase InsO family protein
MGHKITEIRADNGATFKSIAFATMCSEHNITLRFSAPYSPHQNAPAERPWRTLAEMTLCLLVTAGLPRNFWELAFKHSVYLHNRTYRSGLDGIPLTVATGVIPDLSHIRIFGCNAYTHVDSALHRKLEDKAWKGIYVGRSHDSPAWLVYNPNSRRVIASRGVIFDEAELLSHFQDTATNGSPEEPLCELDPQLSSTYNQTEMITTLTQTYVPPTDVGDDDTGDDDSAHPLFSSTANPHDPLTARLIVSPPGILPEQTLSTNVQPVFPDTMPDDVMSTPESTLSPNQSSMEDPTLHHDTSKDLQRQDRVRRLPTRFHDSETILFSQQQQHHGGSIIDDAAYYPPVYPVTMDTMPSCNRSSWLKLPHYYRLRNRPLAS